MSSAVFQAGGLVVVLVEVIRKAYLASIVPVIVNAVLNEHQLIVDIVAFVSRGDFPRSRLGEKQRGKILAGWVTRKMRTIAQFSIRDADGADSQITEIPEPRSGVGSIIGKGSSLRNVETAGSSTIHGEERQQPTKHNYALPTGISEMPTEGYDSPAQESPPTPLETEDRGNTPTESQSPQYFASEDQLYSPDHPSPLELSASSYRSELSGTPSHHELAATSYHPELEAHTTTYHSELPANPYHPTTYPDADPNEPVFEIIPPKPRHTSRPALAGHDPLPSQRIQQPLPPLPRAPMRPSAAHDGPSTAGLGKLRIANQISDDEKDEADEWPREALMHMNLASGNGNRNGMQRKRDGREGS